MHLSLFGCALGVQVDTEGWVGKVWERFGKGVATAEARHRTRTLVIIQAQSGRPHPRAVCLHLYLPVSHFSQTVSKGTAPCKAWNLFWDRLRPDTLHNAPASSSLSFPGRADSIVRDAEQVRKTLVPSDVYAGRWSIIGQSFGGFCAVSYLSMYPNSLIEVMITGGIPPDVTQRCSADAVYRALYRRVILQVWGRVWVQVLVPRGQVGMPTMCSPASLMPAEIAMFLHTLWSTQLQHQCYYLST